MIEFIMRAWGWNCWISIMSYSGCLIQILCAGSLLDSGHVMSIFTSRCGFPMTVSMFRLDQSMTVQHWSWIFKFQSYFWLWNFLMRSKNTTCGSFTAKPGWSVTLSPPVPRSFVACQWQLGQMSKKKRSGFQWPGSRQRSNDWYVT